MTDACPSPWQLSKEIGLAGWAESLQIRVQSQVGKDVEEAYDKFKVCECSAGLPCRDR